MSIDKSLYAAPQGLGALNADPISVEIVDPEEVHIEGPGFEMHIEHGNETEFDTNIAELMPDNQLLTLAYDLLGEVEEDINSRKDWLDTYVKVCNSSVSSTRNVRSLGPEHAVSTTHCSWRLRSSSSLRRSWRRSRQRVPSVL